MELRFEAMLYSNLDNENSDADHIKCSRGPHLARGPRVPYTCLKPSLKSLFHYNSFFASSGTFSNILG